MSSADQREEVQRILQSAQFRRAPKLQRFLELVCDYHFQGRSAEINEWLEFGPLPNACVAPVRRVPSLRSVWMILAGTVLACLAVLVAADHERRLLIQTASAAGRSAALSAPIAGLWNRFLDSDVPTLLVVSNPDVGECGAQKEGATGCPDEYTGMGEAVAIHLITALFRPAKQTLIVKPSRIVDAAFGRRSQSGRCQHAAKRRNRAEREVRSNLPGPRDCGST